MSDYQKRWTCDYIFDILRELDIHYMFGVPGTNEIPIINGTSYPENDVQYIECLQENVAIGAAMGYAHMTGKPGLVVVHITPGIANCIGNLFNAFRSAIPLVILCAQQQNELVTQEPLLASNTVQLAGQYTKWAHEVRAPEELPLVLQRAFKEAMAPPNGPVFISIPWEFTMVRINDDDRIKGITRISPHFTGDPVAIAAAASKLAEAKNPIIIGGDAIGYADAWAELQELAKLIGAPVLLQTFSSLANFPNNDYHWQGELPGTQCDIQKVFEDHDVAFLCGFSNQAQLTVFKYSDGSLIPPQVQQIYLSNSTWDIGKNYYGEVAVFGDIKATLPLINNLIRQSPPADAPKRNLELRELDERRRLQWQAYLDQALQQKEIWAVVIADALRQAILERELEQEFVYIHEAVSNPAPFQYLLPLGTEYSKPISYYCVGGGSLGWSMPASIGIKLEKTGWQGIETKLVINAIGDGSTLMSPQSWWTIAHHKLNVLYIITNNHEYHTLQMGLMQVVQEYGSAPGYEWEPKTLDPEYLKIERPKIDFVALGSAFGGQKGGIWGIQGEIVPKPEDVRAAVERGIDFVLQNKQSYILDMRMDPAPEQPPSTDAEFIERKMACYRQQPLLNIYHQSKGKLRAEGMDLPANMPYLS
ncbi:MAG: thiamine pyrophosphate-binding protein [Oscillatoria sp. SIO1A7]|nr:thiamine pyrophosphate-binding protein [Oscillatoria sp. SIO1A7]